MIEEIFEIESKAIERKLELEKEYALVKVFPVRYGGRRKHDYHYVVRAYTREDLIKLSETLGKPTSFRS
jgi:hypothetical protein